MTVSEPSEVQGEVGQPDDFDDYNEYDDDLSDEDCMEEECGRWMNGRLSGQCMLAGTEWCDWECPIGLGGKR